MIGSSLRIVFLGLGSLLLTWAAFLLVPSFSHGAVASQESWFSEAFPSWPRLRKIGVSSAPEVPPVPFQLLPFGPEAIRPLENILKLRSEIAVHILPTFAFSLTAAFITALLVRERLRFGTGYASPTVSFLAKRMAEGAVLMFILLTFSPFPLPYWAYYPVLGATALGAFGYVANLPLRL